MVTIFYITPKKFTQRLRHNKTQNKSYSKRKKEKKTYLVPSKAVNMRKIKYAGRFGLKAVPIEHAKNKNAVTKHT